MITMRFKYGCCVANMVVVIALSLQSCSCATSLTLKVSKHERNLLRGRCFSVIAAILVCYTTTIRTTMVVLGLRRRCWSEQSTKGRMLMSSSRREVATLSGLHANLHEVSIANWRIQAVYIIWGSTGCQTLAENLHLWQSVIAVVHANSVALPTSHCDCCDAAFVFDHPCQRNILSAVERDV